MSLPSTNGSQSGVFEHALAPDPESRRRLHQARHTYASFMIAAGVNAKAYDIPVPDNLENGFSDTHSDWTVNVPGNVVSAIGHVHGHGVAVEATNESAGGRSICRSTATLDPTNVHNVLSMSPCVDNPLATIQSGQTVRLHSEYQSAHYPLEDVMGIMLMYVRLPVSRAQD